MEWIIVIALVIVIFFITKRYDNEIKMLNNMIELNRNAIDENTAVKPKTKKPAAKKSIKETVGEKKRTTKKSTAKKSPAKKAKIVAVE
jgi:Sec-independent protein translocase protein TatA